MPSFTRRYAGAFAFVAAVYVLLIPPAVRNALAMRGAFPLGIYGTFWASGWSAAHHLNPYLWYPPVPRFRPYGTGGPTIVEINLNPPAMLPLFSALSRFDARYGAAIAEFLSVLVVLAVAFVLARRYNPQRRAVLWLFTCGATLGTFTMLQDYMLLLLLAAIAYLFLDDHQDIPAGICLGVLAAIKPNFLLWPALLILSGRRKLLLPSLTSFLLLTATPVLLYGPAVYRDWLNAARGDMHGWLPADASLRGMFGRMGLPTLGGITALVLLGLLAWLAWRGRPTLREATGMAVCGAILCSPLGWINYTLVAAPVLLATRWNRRQTVAAFFLWIPANILQAHCTSNRFVLGPIGSIYPLAMALMLATFAEAPLRRAFSAPALGRRTAAFEENPQDLLTPPIQ